MKRFLLWKMTYEEVERAAGRARIVIIPTGSTEQHGPHLTLIHDTASALHMAKLVAERLYPKVLVTTPIPFGQSEYHMWRMGTLTLKEDTFERLLFDVIGSLQRHGFRNIFILNGHGGNCPLIPKVVEQANRELGIKVLFASYWDFMPEEAARGILESGNVPGHAGEFETSFGLAAFPEYVRREKINEGDAKMASRDKGIKLIQIIVEALCIFLRKNFSLPDSKHGC